MRGAAELEHLHLFTLATLIFRIQSTSEKWCKDLRLSFFSTRYISQKRAARALSVYILVEIIAAKNKFCNKFKRWRQVQFVSGEE
jgi:hypothetical protein